MKNFQELKKDFGKDKFVAMLAPSFVAEFDYPYLIRELRRLGFDKIVELTFGAKVINKFYHEKLKNSDKLLISSVCPGVVETIRNKFPKYKDNLIKFDSPMIATAKICRKIYPKHKIVFISPCNFKKIESESSKFIDFAIDYQELWELIESCNIKNKEKKGKEVFDKFYNDYTKIYPLAKGLSKTAHIKGVLHENQTLAIDGILEVEKFLINPDKNVKFLDVTFCKGGCIGGPFLKRFSLVKRKKRILDYIELAKRESIPENRKGILKQAEGIDFTKDYN